jgi:hypothetical protein
MLHNPGDFKFSRVKIAQGIKIPTFEAGDLNSHVRRHHDVLVGESRWVAFGPVAQFLPLRRQKVAHRCLLVGRTLLIERGHRQRGVSASLFRVGRKRSFGL